MTQLAEISFYRRFWDFVFFSVWIEKSWFGSGNWRSDQYDIKVPRHSNSKIYIFFLPEIDSATGVGLGAEVKSGKSILIHKVLEMKTINFKVGKLGVNFIKKFWHLLYQFCSFWSFNKIWAFFSCPIILSSLPPGAYPIRVPLTWPILQSTLIFHPWLSL